MELHSDIFKDFKKIKVDKNSLKLYHYFLKLFGEERLVKSFKLLPLGIKSINQNKNICTLVNHMFIF